ncbi:hypothetical protein ACFPZL_08580 [Leucobacter soli]|uniref:Lipoprotein n=1 Tax=Leucobacter soli TaxID=2812850 RepID=A0A916JZQ8_9MICO|nr:hypothetical protein [Leucobacter soli]CAG7618030.1 hypothetical protein LEUCIP111803_02165 [Leucobacter soli]
MTGSREPRSGAHPLRTGMCALAVPVLALTLSACAPEPGSVSWDENGSGPTATDEGKQITGDDESGWGGANDQEDPELKHAELPDGFPSADFPLPEDAVLDDAGARDPGTWFVVLRAADASQADDWWDRIVSDGSFTVRKAEKTDDGGRSAILVGPDLHASALTLAQDDGSVLLSYDLSYDPDAVG